MGDDILYDERGNVIGEDGKIVGLSISLEKYGEFLDELFTFMRKILLKKRHDYGNSYEIIRERFGKIVPLIRLNDKLMRYENLIKKGEDPENEPLLDVFYDIIGYAILEIGYRKGVLKNE